MAVALPARSGRGASRDEPVIRRLKSFVPNADESLWTLVRGLGQGQSLTSFAHMRRPVITAMDPSPARLRMTE